MTAASALGAVEDSSRILNLIYNGSETDDITEIQKAVFTEKNLYCAVCTDKCNFDKAEKIISKLKLYSCFCGEKVVFYPDCTDKITQTDKAVNNISLAFTSDAGFAEKYAVCVFLQNTYLWDNIRCKGAYGCDCGVTPNGNIYITSFKDVNFEKSIDTMRSAFSHISQQHFSDSELHKLKLMCLNKLLRPKTPKNANIYALEQLCGTTASADEILKTDEKSIIFAAKSTKFAALSALKAKNQ